jgi:hypothetical protein
MYSAAKGPESPPKLNLSGATGVIAAGLRFDLLLNSPNIFYPI